MKIAKRGIVGIMLMTMAIAGPAEAGAAARPLGYLVVDTDRGRVVATVTDTTLRIACESKCSIRPYAEVVGDIPLGLFRLSDIRDNLITTWATGDAYVVRIYALSGPKVRKILEIWSRGQPDFYMDSRGRDHVRIFVRKSERSTELIRQDWMWTGSNYVRTSGP